MPFPLRGRVSGAPGKLLLGEITRGAFTCRLPYAGAGSETVDLNTLILQVVGLTRARWNDMPQQRGVVVTVSTALEEFR